MATLGGVNILIAVNLRGSSKTADGVQNAQARKKVGRNILQPTNQPLAARRVAGQKC
jgi:hypothetical protein